MQRGDIIVEYWNGRSDSYSTTVRQELENDDYQAWHHVLINLSSLSAEGKQVLDLGCDLDVDRPTWDLHTLDLVGFDSAFADEDVWKNAWPKRDQKFYASRPLFMVNATK